MAPKVEKQEQGFLDRGIEWIQNTLQEMGEGEKAGTNAVSVIVEAHPDPTAANETSAEKAAGYQEVLQSNPSTPVTNAWSSSEEPLMTVGDLKNERKSYISESPLTETPQSLEDGETYAGSLTTLYTTKKNPEVKSPQQEAAAKLRALSQKVRTAEPGQTAEEILPELKQATQAIENEDIWAQFGAAENFLELGEVEAAETMIKKLEQMSRDGQLPFSKDLNAVLDFEDQVRGLRDQLESFKARLDFHSTDLVTQIEKDLKIAKQELFNGSSQDLNQAMVALDEAKTKLEKIKNGEVPGNFLGLPKPLQIRFETRIAELEKSRPYLASMSQKETFSDRVFEATAEGMFANLDVGPKEAREFTKGFKKVGDFGTDLNQADSGAETVGTLVGQLTPGYGDVRDAHDTNQSIEKIRNKEGKTGDYLMAGLGTVGVMSGVAARGVDTVQAVRKAAQGAKNASKIAKADEATAYLRMLGRVKTQYQGHTEVVGLINKIEAKAKRIIEWEEAIVKTRKEAASASREGYRKQAKSLENHAKMLEKESERFRNEMGDQLEDLAKKLEKSDAAEASTKTKAAPPQGTTEVKPTNTPSQSSPPTTSQTTTAANPTAEPEFQLIEPKVVTDPKEAHASMHARPNLVNIRAAEALPGDKPKVELSNGISLRAHGNGPQSPFIPKHTDPGYDNVEKAVAEGKQGMKDYATQALSYAKTDRRGRVTPESIGNDINRVIDRMDNTLLLETGEITTDRMRRQSTSGHSLPAISFSGTEDLVHAAGTKAINKVLENKDQLKSVNQARRQVAFEMMREGEKMIDEMPLPKLSRVALKNVYESLGLPVDNLRLETISKLELRDALKKAYRKAVMETFGMSSMWRQGQVPENPMDFTDTLKPL